MLVNFRIPTVAEHMMRIGADEDDEVERTPKKMVPLFLFFYPRFLANRV